MLSPEERLAAVNNIADKLIDLYDQRDAALDQGDTERLYDLQAQIDCTAAKLAGSLTAP
jgi:hypothetical protein